MSVMFSLSENQFFNYFYGRLHFRERGSPQTTAKNKKPWMLSKNSLTKNYGWLGGKVRENKLNNHKVPGFDSQPGQTFEKEFKSFFN